MSLIIALHLGEGIIMASDSRTTFCTTIRKEDGTLFKTMGFIIVILHIKLF